MKLTALQQVMRDIEEHYPKMFDIYTQEGRDFISRFHKYIEIEKQQIMHAFKSGWHRDNSPQQYYSETYKTPETDDFVQD